MTKPQKKEKPPHFSVEKYGRFSCPALLFCFLKKEFELPDISMLFFWKTAPFFFWEMHGKLDFFISPW